MPYGLIVVVAAIALSAAYVLLAEAPAWSKALVVVVLVTSFLWRYGNFLQVGLGVFLSLYFIYVRSRGSK
jgi:hypothetical protein